jgi:hypothetical protein
MHFKNEFEKLKNLIPYKEIAMTTKWQPINNTIKLIVLFVFLFSIIAPASSVLADDSTPPAETSEAVDEPVEEGTLPQEDTAPEAETSGSEELDSEAPAAEIPAGEPTIEEPTTELPVVAEETEAAEEPVLAQLPEGTDVVVLDNEGQVMSLVAQETAQVIANSDPMWCPDGVDPIALTGGCTDGFQSMSALLTTLAGASQPAQNGTIWIQSTYSSSNEPFGTSSITIDGFAYSSWRNYSLAIMGGWDGPGTNTASGTTTFSGDRFRIINWRNDVTVRNLIIENASNGPGLEVEIDLAGSGSDSNPAYDITLDNVIVRNNMDDFGAFLYNSESPGSVTVTNSQFINTGNNRDGLYITARGNVTLQNVDATDNGDEGVEIDNSTGLLGSMVQVTGSTFNNNGGNGLRVTSEGDITLVDVTADSNGGDGAHLDNSSGANDDNITVVKSTFINNNDDGLDARSNDNITLINVTAQNNNNDGAFLSTATNSGATVLICGGLFSGQSGSNDFNVEVTGASDATRIRSTDLAPYTNWSPGSSSWTSIANGTGLCNFLDSDGDQIPNQWDIDDDNDNVLDTADLCPGTPAGQPVNANGCAASQLDTDDDGVSDAADQCPGTPAGEPVNANGCSASQLDTDNDGVSDAADQCPGTPAGEPVNANGCSASQLDTDNDGVSDAADQCPGTPAGEAVNVNGCSEVVCPFGLELVDNTCVDVSQDADGTDDMADSTTQAIPLTSGQPINLSCATANTVLQMAGFEVTFANLCGYSTLLDEALEGSLRSALSQGNAFVGGINITLLQNGAPVSSLPTGASIILSFDLPAGMNGDTLAILYWDPAANGGKGGWLEKAVSLENGQVVTTVDVPGTFVLVDRAIARENNLSSLLASFFNDLRTVVTIAFN